MTQIRSNVQCNACRLFPTGTGAHFGEENSEEITVSVVIHSHHRLTAVADVWQPNQRNDKCSTTIEESL